MIIGIIIGALILALIIGVILICEWSTIAVKVYEEERKANGRSKTRIL